MDLYSLKCLVNKWGGVCCSCCPTRNSVLWRNLKDGAKETDWKCKPQDVSSDVDRSQRLALVLDNSWLGVLVG